MRTLRKFIDIAIPLSGVALILGAVLFLRSDLRVQIAAVGLGMLLIEVGVWKFPHQLLRITSYNVCYTKLLRQQRAVGCRRPR